MSSGCDILCPRGCGPSVKMLGDGNFHWSRPQKRDWAERRALGVMVKTWERENEKGVGNSRKES